MEKGTEPTDEKVLALAQRWYELGERLTGGDPNIIQSVTNYFENEWHQLENQPGFDSAVFEYIAKTSEMYEV